MEKWPRKRESAKEALSNRKTSLHLKSSEAMGKIPKRKSEGAEADGDGQGQGDPPILELDSPQAGSGRSHSQSIDGPRPPGDGHTLTHHDVHTLGAAFHPRPCRQAIFKSPKEGGA